MGRSIQSRIRKRLPGGTSIQKRIAAKRTDAVRPNAAARGYDAVWQVLRAQHLAENPWCVKCERKATHVDHIVPHRGDDLLRLEPRNLQSMCPRCHSRKTVTEDGGFGNRRKNGK